MRFTLESFLIAVSVIVLFIALSSAPKESKLSNRYSQVVIHDYGWPWTFAGMVTFTPTEDGAMLGDATSSWAFSPLGFAGDLFVVVLEFAIIRSLLHRSFGESSLKKTTGAKRLTEAID